MMPGGFGNVKEVDEEVAIIALNMKETVENTLGETYDIYEPVLYTSQVVAGTNYKIKIHVGDEKFIHIKVYVPLSVYNSPNELLEAESNMTLFDPLK